MLTPSVGGVYAISVTAPGGCRGVQSSAHGMINIYTQRVCECAPPWSHATKSSGGASHVPYVCFFFLHPDGLNARVIRCLFERTAFAAGKRARVRGT